MIGRFMSAAALLCALLPGDAFAQSQPIEIDLARMQPGAAPPDFDSRLTGEGSVGQWVVVADETASQGRAIEQISTDPTDRRFPLAIYTPMTARDIEVVIRFKAIAGKVDQAGGIAVRLQSPDAYYIVRANALEDDVRFFRVVKGRREQIAARSTKVSSGEWHTLGLLAVGDHFAISFDSKPLFTATDATYKDAGRVALWTKADSVTRFDKITIKALQ